MNVWNLWGSMNRLGLGSRNPSRPAAGESAASTGRTHDRIDNLSDEDLQEIVMTYNLTPRKCLGYITPIQAFFKDLGRDVRLRFA